MLLKFFFLFLFSINICYLFHIKSESIKKTRIGRLFAKEILRNNTSCGNKNKDCLENYIHRHLLHKQKHANKFINRGLNISSEKKFIQEVLKSMLDDNADTFRDINEDDIRFSKDLINTHKKAAWIKHHGEKKFHSSSHHKHKKEHRQAKNLLVNEHSSNLQPLLVNEHLSNLQPILPELIKLVSKKSLIFDVVKNNTHQKFSLQTRNRVESKMHKVRNENEKHMENENNMKFEIKSQTNKMHNNTIKNEKSAVKTSKQEPIVHTSSSNIFVGKIDKSIYSTTEKNNYQNHRSIPANASKDNFQGNNFFNKTIEEPPPHQKITISYAIGDQKSKNGSNRLYQNVYPLVNFVQNLNINNDDDDDDEEDDDENHERNSVEKCKHGQIFSGKKHNQIDYEKDYNSSCKENLNNKTTCMSFLKCDSIIEKLQRKNNSALNSTSVFSINVNNNSVEEFSVNSLVNEKRNISGLALGNSITDLHFESESDALAEKRNKLGKKLNMKKKSKADRKKLNKNQRIKNYAENAEKSLPQDLLNIDEQIVALESGWDLEDGSNSSKEEEKSADGSGENESMFYSNNFYKEFDQVVQNNTDGVREDQNNIKARHLFNINLKGNRKILLNNGLHKNTSEERELSAQSFRLNQIDINRKKMRKSKNKKLLLNRNENKKLNSQELYDKLETTKNLQVNWNDYVNSAQQSIVYQGVGKFQNSYNPNSPINPVSLPQESSLPQIMYQTLPAINYLAYRFQEPVMPLGVTSYPTPHYEYPTVSYGPSNSIPTPKKVPDWAITVPDGKIKASRVCKPGPMKPAIGGKPNCLIIGDSIALGYSYSVATALKNHCQVQLTPSSKAGVALDSSYGLQCLEMFLATSDLTPTYYDVIVFNFGLHDIDYLEKYPEEHSSIERYTHNLRKIKEKLLATGASLAFVLSTPVSFNKKKDDLLKTYNHAAKLIMEEKPRVLTVNLHKLVTKQCGHAPFENCFMMKKPHDVHYGVTGTIILGKRIAFAIKYLLDKRKDSNHGKMPVPKHIVDLSINATTCPIQGDQCPARMTCTNNIVSRSGNACCSLMHAVDCEDSWHCCPKGTICHPGCSDLKCSCIK